MRRLLAAGAFGAMTLAFLALHSLAADTNSPTRREHTVGRRALLPFKGRITALDLRGLTVTVGERVFQITPKTKFTRANRPAALQDAKVGETVQGTYGNSADGKLFAELIRFPAKPPKSGSKTKGDGA